VRTDHEPRGVREATDPGACHHRRMASTATSAVCASYRPTPSPDENTNDYSLKYFPKAFDFACDT